MGNRALTVKDLRENLARYDDDTTITFWFRDDDDGGKFLAAHGYMGLVLRPEPYTLGFRGILVPRYHGDASVPGERTCLVLYPYDSEAT